MTKNRMRARLKFCLVWLVVAAFSWPAFRICFQLLGRSALYLLNGAAPYKNHVGNDYFDWIAGASHEAVPWSLAALIIALFFKARRAAIAAALLAVGCALTPAIFNVYRSHHTLVTYNEFADDMLGITPDDSFP